MEPKLKAWEPDYGEEKTWATPESACPASCVGAPTCERATPLILRMLAVRWIAIRNLIISVPNLLLSFATWLVWSMIVAKIQKLHDKDPTVYNFGEHGRLQPAVLAGLRLHHHGAVFADGHGHQIGGGVRVDAADADVRHDAGQAAPQGQSVSLCAASQRRGWACVAPLTAAYIC